MEELNSEQILVYNDLTEKFNTDNIFKVFVNGQAGTGKTKKVKKCLEKCPNYKKIVVTSMTHKALNVIKQGLNVNLNINYKTIHKLFGGYNEYDNEGKPCFIKGAKMKEINFDILIVEEIGMIPDEQVEYLYNQNNVSILGLGDFRQLPPIRNFYNFTMFKINEDNQVYLKTYDNLFSEPPRRSSKY